MDEPTTVNPEETDSVTQAGLKVLGDSPAVAMGNLYQATAQALANAAHNATAAQSQMNVTAEATTLLGLSSLLGGRMTPPPPSESTPSQP